MIDIIVKYVFIEPWPFWAGGLVIGLLVPLLYYFYNTPLSVSTGYGNLARIFFRAHHLKWIKSTAADPLNWRIFFIAGIILGGFISARLSGAEFFTMEMGQFTRSLEWPVILSALYFFIGGTFLGLGARIAGGCTSGHSIHGLSNLHFSSLMVTIMFLIGGFISANIIRLLLLGGV